jgi:hypothetical protein
MATRQASIIARCSLGRLVAGHEEPEVVGEPDLPDEFLAEIEPADGDRLGIRGGDRREGLILLSDPHDANLFACENICSCRIVGTVLTSRQDELSQPPEERPAGGRTTMRDINQFTVTEGGQGQLQDRTGSRFEQLLHGLIDHLHDFTRENNVTHEEWMGALMFLYDMGQISTPERHEFILLSDVIGWSALVDMINTKGGATEGRTSGRSTSTTRR